MNWFFLGGALSCAGFIQSLTGFGFGLVSMSLLPLFMSVKEAAAISTVFSFLATITTFIRHAHDYNWRLGFGFFLSVCLGVPVGVFFLEKTAEPLLLHILGTVMLVICAREFLWKKKLTAFPKMLVLPFGMFSGALSGAFNLGGIPTVAYAYAHTWSRGQIMAFLQVTITTSCALRMPGYIKLGYFKDFSWSRGALIAIPLYLSIWLGHALLKKIDPQHVRHGVFVFIGMAGIYYLFIH